MTDIPCPVCGNPIAGVPVEALEHVHLTRMQRKIVAALTSIYPRTVPLAQLADLVWADDPTGGPESATNNLSVHFAKMNPTLKRFGWRVGAKMRGAKGVGLYPLQDHQ